MRNLIFALCLLLAPGVHARTVQLTTANTITLRGVIDGDSVLAVEQKVAQAQKDRLLSLIPLYLVIDSPGGSIDAGLSLIEFLKTVPNLNTISIFSASMASGIVEALPGQRLVLKSGVLKFHRAKGAFEGQFNYGEVESRLKMAKAIVDILETTNAGRMGLSVDAYRDKVKDEWWMIGQQAVVEKSADEQVDIVCSQPLIAATESATESFLFMQSKVTFSRCPLLRSPISTENPDKE